MPDGAERITGGLVGVSGGGGSVGVSGGGIGVSVSVGKGVSVGNGVLVLVGMDMGVFVGTKAVVEVGRGRLVRVGVTVTKCFGVEVSEGRGVGESVLVGTRVCVGTNRVTTCSVRAATVSRLETAKSRTLSGSIVIEIWLFKSPIAIVETLHSTLMPIAAAARTPRGPEYSLAFTRVALLYRYRSGYDVCCRRSDVGIIPQFCSYFVRPSLQIKKTAAYRLSERSFMVWL